LAEEVNPSVLLPLHPAASDAASAATAMRTNGLLDISEASFTSQID
jgi:hypothetical protein